MEERDIWRTAAFLIREHGEDARLVAARRASELHEQGDEPGTWVWIKIWRAIHTLNGEKPRKGEAVN